MKNKKTAVLLVVIITILAFTFSACGSSFDPVAFVKGNLDVVFHGNYDEEFLATLDDENDEESLKAMRKDIINQMVDLTMTSLNLESTSEESSANLYQMFEDVMDATKYEVGQATETDDGYAVDVTIYPLTTFMSMCKDESGVITQAFTEKVTADMSEQQLYELFLTEFCAAMKTALATPTYADAQTYTVHVILGDDGKYTITDKETEEISSLLLNL